MSLKSRGFISRTGLILVTGTTSTLGTTWDSSTPGKMLRIALGSIDFIVGQHLYVGYLGEAFYLATVRMMTSTMSDVGGTTSTDGRKL